MAVAGFEARAALTGTAVGLAIAVPPLLVVRGWKRGDESGLWVVVVIAMLVGFAVSGFVAGRRRPDAPYLHAAVASGACAIALALGSVLPKLIDGEAVPWLAIAVLVQIAMSLGVAGGHVGMRIARRRRSAEVQT